ncbi:hypothetical protein BJ165DRAFT_1398402 [Panaeolus papilionaceus]|nr:hypothetical protein BJ165DRAFT_1398402 [Panaeolus papilionaceus]
MRSTTYLLITLVSFLSMLQSVSALVGYVSWISQTDNRDGTFTHSVTITEHATNKQYFTSSRTAKRLKDEGIEAYVTWVSFDVPLDRSGQPSQTATNVEILRPPQQ